jgi:hypothetical protein
MGLLVGQMLLAHAVAAWQPVTRQVLAGFAIGQLVGLTILTSSRWSGSPPAMDQTAGRSFHECHERERNRIRCNPCA